jgi:hypothetical protein
MSKIENMANQISVNPNFHSGLIAQSSEAKEKRNSTSTSSIINLAAFFTAFVLIGAVLMEYVLVGV